MTLALLLSGCIPPFPEPSAEPPPDTDSAPLVPTGHTGTPIVDGDNDGAPAGEDCDDEDPDRFPGNPEHCEDGVDQDCSGEDAPCVPTGAVQLATVAAASINGPFVVGPGANLDGQGPAEIVAGFWGGTRGWRVWNLDGGALVPYGSGDIPANESVLAAAGDVDGNGNADLVVVGGGQNTPPPAEVHLVHGPTLDVKSRQEWIDVVPGGFSPGFGYDLALVPDYDGDGHPDVLVGGFLMRNGATPAGAVVLGTGATGTGPLTVALEVRLPDVGYSVGGTVAAADLTGDGLTELMVGTAGDPGGPDPMQIVVFDSGLSGTRTAPAGVISALKGKRGAQHGWQTGTAYPAAPATGDVNGDGCDDLIGGFYYDEGGRGTAQLLLGCRKGGLPIEVGPDESVKPDSRILGVPSTGFGYDAAVVPGFDGDAAAEIAIGAPFRGGDAGSVYVLAGAGLPADVDLVTTPEAALVVLQGPGGYQYAGSSVAPAGDVNDDGFGDLVLSGPGLQAGETSWVVLGGALP